MTDGLSILSNNYISPDRVKGPDCFSIARQMDRHKDRVERTWACMDAEGIQVARGGRETAE